jgi:hypothetical protein
LLLLERLEEGKEKSDIPGNCHSDNEIGGGDEGVGGRVGIVTSSEVSVVRGDDGVSLTLLDVLSVPLS